MKIGIVYDDVNREELDCSRPDLGNPGVGGTQFCELMLIYYLAQKYTDIELYVYHYKELNYKCKMPAEESVHYESCSGIEAVPQCAYKNGVQILIFTPGHTEQLTPLLEEYEISGVVWIHNWIRGNMLNRISEASSIKRAVFLGEEHYDRYIDHDIINKSVIIPNMFCSEGYSLRNDKLEHVVTYTGALIQGKGFDMLAREWKDVLKKVPDAELYVLGKGNLYGGNQSFGKLGLAEKSFEDKFLPYIIDEQDRLLPSIHFMGIMGKEKKEIYNNTKVGVINPTAVTEVCPISALEMEAAGIPVVSKSKNGLPDVVINGKTGILIKKQKELSSAIAELLLKDDKNIQYGNNARKDVEERFSPITVSKEWHLLFKNIIAEKPVDYIAPTGKYGNNHKWIRIVNRNIRKVFHRLPPIIEVEALISNKLRSI